MAVAEPPGSLRYRVGRRHADRVKALGARKLLDQRAELLRASKVEIGVVIGRQVAAHQIGAERTERRARLHPHVPILRVRGVLPWNLVQIVGHRKAAAAARSA